MDPKQRPSEAVFADGKTARILALRPEAIGVAYPTRQVYDRKTYELRDAVASDVAEIVGSVAVICVDGPLEHKGGDAWWSYWQSYEQLAIDFKLILDDPSIEAVVLKFDSPGGEVSGLNETVAIMKGMKAASGKPVIGYVDEACYSAAYALAMVCDELYLPESGGVGSIGVITAMSDVTAMLKKDGIRVEVIASGTKKTDGHPYVPMSDGAIKRTRKKIDQFAASFFDLVAGGRGLSVETVAGFQAGTFNGQSAVDVGLADGVMSLSDCLTLAKEQFTSSTVPTDQSEEKESPNMSGQIAAAKAIKDAQAALASAKTVDAKAAASARVVAAEKELAKVKKTKTVTTDTHEEEVDDGEESDAGTDDGDDDSDSGTGSMSDSAEEDEEKKSAMHPGDNATTGLHTKDRLLRHCRDITGKKSIEEVMGALQSMADSTKKVSKLSSEVAALRKEREDEKLSAMISKGMRDGKLAPAQKSWAKTQTLASLSAYLDAAPKMVRTIEESAVPTESVDALTPDEIAMCANARPPVDPAKYAKMKADIRARSGGGTTGTNGKGV